MKNTKSTTSGYLARALRPEGWRIGLLSLLQMLLSVGGVLNAIILGSIVNHASAGDRTAFFRSTLFLALLLLGQVFLRVLFRRLEEATKCRLENRLKQRLLTALLRKDLSSLFRIHSGEWMNRLTSDTVQIADGLTHAIPTVLGMGIKILGILLALAYLEPQILLLIVPCGLLLLLFSTLFRKRSKALHKQVMEADGTLRALLQDIFGAMMVVRAYAIAPEVTEKSALRMEHHRKARLRKSNFSNLCGAGFALFMNGGYLAGVLLCGYGILTGTLPYGTFLSMIQLIGQVQAPFANISGFLPKWHGVLASAERLMEAEMLAEQQENRILPLSEVCRRYHQDFHGITFSQVGFAYDGDPSQGEAPDVLKNFSCRIHKGEKVALVGPSGCGKSTVMKLLMALYSPSEGTLSIDFASGSAPLDAGFRRLFAYVPQGNLLMSGTIRDMVTLPDDSRSQDDAAIWAALETACADDFVRELELGLDTPLGERGLGLSEGQLQRIAIARAIFSGRPILLLDEATSALDAPTEQAILENIKKMTDMTVILITHRPAALSICDRTVEFRER